MYQKPAGCPENIRLQSIQVCPSFQVYNDKCECLLGLKGDVDLPSNTVNPRTEDKGCACQTKHSRKDLDANPTIRLVDDGSGDGVGDETADRGNEEDDACSEANLSHGRDLGHERSDEGDVGAGAETEEGSKGNDSTLSLAGDPKGKDPDGCEIADKDKDVVLSNLVTQDTRDDTSKETGRVEDGDKVVDNAGLQTDLKRLDWKVVDRDIHAKGEEEETENDKHELWLTERLHHLSLAHVLGVRGVQSLDGEVGNDEQAENQEATGAHGPAKTNLLDHPANHDGEDNTTDA